jgi:hypothetical protein
MTFNGKANELFHDDQSLCSGAIRLDLAPPSRLTGGSLLE